MKTIASILSDIISETFEKTNPAAWKETPAFRPGPVMVPVEDPRTRRPRAPFVRGSRMK
jgi:hypothetical protein